MRTKQLVALLALVVAVSAVASAAPYKIQFDRASVVGSKVAVDLAGTEVMVQTIDVGAGEPQQRKRLSKVSLQATAEVLAVDDTGEATKVAYTIGAFSGSANGQAVDGLDKGQVVTAEVKGKHTALTLKGGTLTPPQKKLLDVVISIKTKGLPSGDETLGTTEPKNVGDSWPINTDAVAKGFKANGMAVEKKNVSGKVTLRKVAKVHGMECLHLAAEISAKDFALPGMPPGTKTVKSLMTATMLGALPVVTKYPRLSRNDKLSMEVAVELANPKTGQTINMTITNNRQVTGTTKPL